MAWAAALGAIGGGATEGMGSMAQYLASKHERDRAWQRQQAWELMAPGLRVEGLKRAGLNPVLAATQGMSGGPGHVQVASTGGKPRFEPDLGVSRVLSSAKQSQAMAGEIRRINASAAAEEERAKQEQMETLFKAEFGRTERASHAAALQEQVMNLVQERLLSGARQSQSEQERLRIMVERELLQMGIPGARAMEEMYQKHPWLRQLREFSGGSLGPAAIGAGVGAVMRGGRKASSLKGEDRHKVKWGLRGRR